MKRVFLTLVLCFLTLAGCNAFEFLNATPPPAELKQIVIEATALPTATETAILGQRETFEATVTTPLHFRHGAGVQFQVINWLEPGDVVIVYYVDLLPVDESKNKCEKWAAVEFRSHFGFVCQQYLEMPPNIK